MWEMTTNGLIRCAGETAVRNFTEAEWSEYFPNEEYRPTFPHLKQADPSKPRRGAGTLD